MPTCTFITFGCKVNQYETQGLREEMIRQGYSEVPPEAEADLYILNTCTVTEAACREAVRIVRRLARNHPRARFTVTGCAAESNAEAFIRLPGVTSVVGHDAKSRLPELVNTGITTSPIEWNARKPRAGARSIFDLTISRFKDHSRAFLKIEDGCDLGCSFCIIPKVRGGPVSRPMAEAFEEARRLVDNGYREIVLTGVHLGSYGKDVAGRSMIPDLVERLLTIQGLGRIRLSSIEVNELTDPVIELMAAVPDRFCPHLHLPLQSGDDAILQAMRRRYNTKKYREACDRVSERIPNPSFTTDVIVGFPGEDTAAFQRTMDLCERIGFSRIHIFPYSPRRGTDAARSPETLPPREKKARVRRLKLLAREWTARYARRFLGHEVSVLVEEENRGYTERYLKARVNGSPNQLIRCRARDLEQDTLICDAAAS